MKNLTIETKVILDLEAIKGTEYEGHLFGFNGRDTVIVTDILFAHQTFCFKPTPKSRIEAILPMSFIKEVA